MERSCNGGILRAEVLVVAIKAVEAEKKKDIE
jgi:hypothetical protein